VLYIEEVSLSSAGGTFSLVNDGTGPILANKGLTPGTNVTIVDSGTALTINSATGASSVWQETAAEISPVTAVTSGLLCGDRTTNSFGGFATNRCVLVGGDTNTPLLT